MSRLIGSESVDARFDPAEWIALPGGKHHVHRGDLRPCECGATLFRLIWVRRRIGRDELGYTLYDEHPSVECPRCDLLTRKRSEERRDERRVIGQFDVTKGIVLDLAREFSVA